MTIAEALLAFTVAAFVLTITPGLDTALILRTGAAGGARAGAFAAVGVGCGCLAWGALVSLGLGALLAASEFAFAVLKWVGALYLCWIGVRMIVRPRRSIASTDAAPPKREAGAALRRGFLTNILNPKVGVFYVTFLPQFVPAGVSVAGFSLLLAGLHVMMGLLWSALLIAATVSMARVLTRPRIIAGLDRLTGVVFVGFGVRLALAQR